MVGLDMQGGLGHERCGGLGFKHFMTSSIASILHVKNADKAALSSVTCIHTLRTACADKCSITHIWYWEKSRTSLAQPPPDADPETVQIIRQLQYRSQGEHLRHALLFRRPKRAPTKTTALIPSSTLPSILLRQGWTSWSIDRIKTETATQICPPCQLFGVPYHNGVGQGGGGGLNGLQRPTEIAQTRDSKKSVSFGHWGHTSLHWLLLCNTGKTCTAHAPCRVLGQTSPQFLIWDPPNGTHRGPPGDACGGSLDSGMVATISWWDLDSFLILLVPEN